MLRTLKTPKPVWKQVLYARRYPDRAAARMAVNEAVKAGTLVNAKTLLCVDCLTPAREYDTYIAFGPEINEPKVKAWLERLDRQPVLL